MGRFKELNDFAMALFLFKQSRHLVVKLVELGTVNRYFTKGRNI